MNIKKTQIIKGEIKLDLIRYYDTLRSDVDLIAQEEIIYNKNQTVIEINLDLIKKIDFIFNLNCKQIDEFFTKTSEQDIEQLDKEDIKALVLTQYCSFVSNKVLNKNYKNKNDLGVFITSDWYLNPNQLDFIRYNLIF
jgi:hypothetical protein